MDCPVCKEPMVVLEYESVEVDYCLSCEGLWLDAGELELLFGDAQACHDFLNAGNPADAARGEKARRCPICAKKMAKAVTGGETPITYDRCRQGDGLWLDGGELAEILKHGAASQTDERVGHLLRDMFSGRAD